MNGRSYAPMSKKQAAAPVAKSPIATRAAARLSPWERAIAIKTQVASITRQAHFTKPPTSGDKDALTACIESGFKRDYHLTLSDSLPLVAGCQSEREL